MIGTHNSMTYAKPYHWYGWLMIPFARCQKKNLREQLLEGARCFDLRIRFDKDGTPYFAHGAMRVKGDVYGALTDLKIQTMFLKEKLLVRLILEDPKLRKEQEILFIDFCNDIENVFGEYMTFFEGRRKGDWALIYDFKHKQPINQFVGSMAEDARWYEKIMPFAYACRKNKANMQLATDVLKDKVNLFDFV